MTEVRRRTNTCKPPARAGNTITNVMNRNNHIIDTCPRRDASVREMQLAELFGVQVRDRKILTRKGCEKAGRKLSEIADLLKSAARTGRPVKLPAQF